MCTFFRFLKFCVKRILLNYGVNVLFIFTSNMTRFARPLLGLLAACASRPLTRFARNPTPHRESMGYGSHCVSYVCQGSHRGGYEESVWVCMNLLQNFLDNVLSNDLDNLILLKCLTGDVERQIFRVNDSYTLTVQICLSTSLGWTLHSCPWWSHVRCTAWCYFCPFFQTGPRKPSSE